MAHLQTTMRAIEAADAEAFTAQAAQATDNAAPTAAIDTVSGAVLTQPVWHDGDPDVSDWVIYQPRRGMIRRGRNRVAALVVHRHEHARILDLAIFYEAGDTLDDQRVPEAVGDERGWLIKTNAPQVTVNRAPREIAEARQDIADLRALIFGTFDQPEVSLLDLLSMLDERVDKLESAKAKTKRKYTRKAKAPAETPKAD